VVRVELDGEVPGPHLRFECGAGPRGVAHEADFPGTFFELELRDGAGQAQRADRLDPRQRGISGKLGGRFHSSRSPPRFARWRSHATAADALAFQIAMDVPERTSAETQQSAAPARP